MKWPDGIGDFFFLSHPCRGCWQPSLVRQLAYRGITFYRLPHARLFVGRSVREGVAYRSSLRGDTRGFGAWPA